jgi:hypothetical protein
MSDKSSVIFGNPMPKSTIKKANKSKKKFIKEFGDDSNKVYHLKAVPNETLDFIGVQNLVLSDEPLKLDDKAFIVGNIRMGFGHYRISIAMASCAKALGYTSYWFYLASFDATGSKVIRKQNDMYSLASRISQKSKLFNKLVREPLNSEGFKKITYNAPDQKNAELMAPLCHDFPKDVPYVGTHVWPSQAAVHAGLTHVVNAIPDNWPMALHLSEGAIHTVQTPFAFLGYKKLNGFAKTELKHMPKGTLKNVGHYIDHELVANLKEDTAKRLERAKGKQLRFLMTVGGAGAQYNLFKDMISFLIPYLKEGRIVLFINFGDHQNVYEKLNKEIKEYDSLNTKFFDEYAEFKKFVAGIDNSELHGIYSVYHKDIFEAVYSTNLLMRFSDLLITKPSELAFYPIPKLMIQRVGGHEAYGAIHASEIGDGTWECRDIEAISSMIKLMLEDDDVLTELNNNILRLNENHTYDGGYEVVKLAVAGKID